jgi:anhydro-N-acetylmuramic acid kinase
MIHEQIKKKSFLAAGLMSGTSMDGIDAALVRLPREGGSAELVAFSTTPYPDELRGSLRPVAYGEQCTAEDVATLHTSVAVAFANAFHNACREAHVTPGEVDFIGSHGQTIAHVPPSDDGTNFIAGTLQLGPPAMIAALTGVTTVGDFRSADIALGGHGAPLAPYADYLLRRSGSENRVILNIGGIANITYLPAGCDPGDVVAFDTGPGNMVLDELYRVLYPTEGSFERMNALIEEGQPSHALLEPFLAMEFFEASPPKSAGHREFGGRFAYELLSHAEAEHVAKPDILASAVSLTTRSIHEAVRRHVLSRGSLDAVYVTGGGSHNRVMMNELRSMFEPVTIAPIDELGIPADAKEAVDFAVLAREALMGRANVFKQVTGASKAGVLGTVARGV